MYGIMTKQAILLKAFFLGPRYPRLFFNKGTNDGKNIEIIDGRQRFETIKRFKDNKINLSDKGLTRLKELGKRGRNNFDGLSPVLTDTFLDTNIRIIEFKVVNEPRLDAQLEDKIKKEIFRRYNSGITPLKSVEIDNAIYNEDNLTVSLKKLLKEEDSLYRKVVEIFFLDNSKEKKFNIEKALSSFRNFLVQIQMPINYSAASRSKEVSSKLYELLSNDLEGREKTISSLIEKVEILFEMKGQFDAAGMPSNRLVFECLFWALSLLENEFPTQILRHVVTKSIRDLLISEISISFSVYNADNSYIYKEILNRYNFTASILRKAFDIDTNLYLNNSPTFQEEIKTLKSVTKKDISIEELEEYRLVRPDPSTKTINLILEEMDRKRFLVRPSYQRGEAINRIKASALIESILLGIKLPPIFIFKRTDTFGTSEVIDGQQRLLSIIGFLGKEFLDENGKRAKSIKNGYSLTKLRILKKLNGKKWSDLSEVDKDKILDFKLSFVIIDQKVNPNFQPIDLFIRLNNKPYPIRENTFEMWNSYIDKDVINTIKENTYSHLNWFYVRAPKKNKDFDRMENEELYTSLAYLDYNQRFHIDKKFSGLDMYQKIDRINVRISKIDISNVLSQVTELEVKKENFFKSIKGVETFIKKLKIVLLDKNIADKKDLINYYKTQLDNISLQKNNVRTQLTFYVLWYALNEINLAMVQKHRLTLKGEIQGLFSFMRTLSIDKTDGRGVEIFTEKISELKNKYQIEERKLKLTEAQKNEMILRHNNKSPLSDSPIFIGDEIEIDHIIPLALQGTDQIENLQPSHPNENRKKGGRG